MASPKLLLGGLVGVGSVSTAAVVAHQQGFFSLSSDQTQSSSDTASTETPSPSETKQDTVVDEKPNQTKIKKWLEENQGTESWEIKIQKGSEPKDFKDPEIKESDLDGLPNHLNTEANKNLLRSIFSALTNKSLTFEKTTENVWKHELTKEEINEWVKTKSKTHATLKLFIGDEEKTLTTITDKGELQKLFEFLKTSEGKFSGLTAAKTLVFKKESNGEWKHIQKFIEDWVTEKSSSSNALKTKAGGAEKVLSNWTDEELKALFDYIKNYQKLFETIKTDSNTPKPVLEFKKEGTNWKLIASQKTIEIWVKATSGEKATLELWEEGTKKELSNISGAEDLKKILECLEKSENKKLFEDLVDKSNKTLVFEKVDNNEWKHIKTAIKDWFSSTDGVSNKLQLKIKKDASTTLSWDDGKIEDTDLTGLLKHLKASGSGYASETPQPVTLQKKANSGTNEWEKAPKDSK